MRTAVGMAAVWAGLWAGTAMGFLDEFTRPDNTTIGNGWSEGADSAWGTESPMPDAAIVSGKLVLSRVGGTPWAFCQIARDVPFSPLVQADVLMPSGTGASSYWTRFRMTVTNANTGRFLNVFLINNSDGTFSTKVYNSTDGTWDQNSWTEQLNTPNPGELQIRFTADSAGNVAFEARKKSDGSLFMSWSGTNAGLSGGFNGISIESYWNDWWNNALTPSVDNVYAGSPPVTVTGTITPQGYLGDLSNVGVAIDFIQDGTTVKSLKTFLGSGGEFTVDDVPGGLCDIVVQCSGCLRKVLTGVNLDTNPKALPPIILTGGNSNGDATVSFEDFAILQNAYGQSEDPLTTLSAAAAGATGGCGPLATLVLASLGLAGAALRCRE